MLTEQRGPWDEAGRVLAIRLDTIGDLLMTTPALSALKQGTAGRTITLLTSRAALETARLVPEIDDVIAYDAPWMKASPRQRSSASDRCMADLLRSARFDAAAIFTVYSQSPLPSAMLCYMADIPLRLAHCHENPYHLLTDWVPDPEPAEMVRHEVRRQLDLVAAVGCRTEEEQLSLRVPREADKAAREALEGAGVDPGRPWIAVHPGASAPSRRYPPALYAEVACRLVGELGLQLVFTGDAEGRGVVEEIRHAMAGPSFSLAGQLNLAELAALLRMAQLLLSNNTGPVHVAAAVGTPVVDLYALTNPQHTPWRVPSRVLSHDVPCKYCYRSVCPEGHHHCLALVSPDQVVAAVADLLAETAESRTFTRRATTVQDGHPERALTREE